jgi:hypothetical protein
MFEHWVQVEGEGDEDRLAGADILGMGTEGESRGVADVGGAVKEGDPVEVVVGGGNDGVDREPVRGWVPGCEGGGAGGVAAVWGPPVD